MKRTVLLYAAALALGSFTLAWLEYKYVTRVFVGELYVFFVAVAFAALGGWAGWRLTPAKKPVAFVRIDAALKSLGVSEG